MVREPKIRIAGIRDAAISALDIGQRGYSYSSITIEPDGRRNALEGTIEAFENLLEQASAHLEMGEWDVPSHYKSATREMVAAIATALERN